MYWRIQVVRGGRGSPVKGFEYSVSVSWIDKGYVKEDRET